MSEKKFSKEQAIKFGWQRTKDNLGFFIVYLIIVFAVEFFFSFFIELFDEAGFLTLSVLFNLGSFVVSIVVSIFGIKIGLRLYENEKIGSYDFLSFSLSTFFKYLLAYLLFFIIIVVGFILLIVPGIYLAIRYQFCLYLIIDKDMDVIDSFKESTRLTDGSKWNLFVFALLQILIVLAGILALLVGLFVAVPIVIVSWAYVYKMLSSATPNAASSTASPPQMPQTTQPQGDNPFMPPSASS
ncbi:MAG: hypothetical protein AAF462_11825, partial [Thermodesulfobacteriota bacterium]